VLPRLFVRGIVFVRYSADAIDARRLHLLMRKSLFDMPITAPA
jgi:hypothetical protein